MALARSLFRKGANFTAAMTFEIASTHLVIELGVIMALLRGWQCTAAELVGEPIMIVVLQGGKGSARRLFSRDGFTSLSHVFALLILPILSIYRKYYGARMAGFLLVTFFAAPAVAGHGVGFAFGARDSSPTRPM
ncbi:uncharacterized membrane protein YraQ (UPF0718 family) [Streptomyces canus]|uniref:Uncharacterized membrane protein YraQ (UPF0718 family) n=2 Tax=Streptomyces canus TaxID=58343 RepID=A0AAW8FF20_9ACTN|nr:uncharacterized membrane protein YraQ (UPF0718 family) [Streptomyces canus]